MAICSVGYASDKDPAPLLPTRRKRRRVRTAMVARTLATNLSLVVAATAWMANASDRNGEFVAFAPGQRGCDVFLKDIRSDDGPQIYQFWIAGVLTGFNQILPDTYDITGNSDFSDVYQW